MPNLTRDALRQRLREIEAVDPMRIERPAAPAGMPQRPLQRLLAALHYFAGDLDMHGPCPEVEATVGRLERDIRAEAARVFGAAPVVRLLFEMDLLHLVDTGKLHPDVLRPFDLVPPTVSAVPDFGADTGDWFD